MYYIIISSSTHLDSALKLSTEESLFNLSFTT
jgi:hypothetical protein